MSQGVKNMQEAYLRRAERAVDGADPTHADPVIKDLYKIIHRLTRQIRKLQNERRRN